MGHATTHGTARTVYTNGNCYVPRARVVEVGSSRPASSTHANTRDGARGTRDTGHDRHARATEACAIPPTAAARTIRPSISMASDFMQTSLRAKRRDGGHACASAQGMRAGGSRVFANSRESAGPRNPPRRIWLDQRNPPRRIWLDSVVSLFVRFVRTASVLRSACYIVRSCCSLPM